MKNVRCETERAGDRHRSTLEWMEMEAFGVSDSIRAEAADPIRPEIESAGRAVQCRSRKLGLLRSVLAIHDQCSESE